MKRLWPIFLILLGGCSSKSSGSSGSATTSKPAVAQSATALQTAAKTAETAAPTSAPVVAPPPLSTGEPLAGGACTKQVSALGSWLKQLHQEGVLLPSQPGISLVSANQAATTAPAGARVAVDADHIFVEGTQVVSSKEPGFDTAAVSEALKKRADALKQAPGATGALSVILELDAGAPWHAIAKVADIAMKLDFTFAMFLFSAPTLVSAPPKTPEHVEFHKRFATGTEDVQTFLTPSDPATPGVLATVYKDCEAAQKVKHSPAAEFGRDLSKAIAACDCKVNMADVQAVAWLMYGRYQGAVRAGLTVNLARPETKTAQDVSAVGSKVWSETNTLIREAILGGKPIRLVAQ